MRVLVTGACGCAIGVVIVCLFARHPQARVDALDINVARQSGHPELFVILRSAPLDGQGPRGRKLRQMGSPGAPANADAMAELDSRLGRRTDGAILVKPRALAFWRAPLDAYRIARNRLAAHDWRQRQRLYPVDGGIDA